MKNINRFTFSLIALLVASSLALAAPVAARDGQDDTTTNTSGRVKDLTTKLRHQGEVEIEAHKQSGKQKTNDLRQKACVARKNNLTKKMSNSVAWAKKHKTVIDTAYSRVKDFHDSKHLNVPNYDSLTSSVNTAQDNAQTSIDALSALEVNVDCSSQTVATSVSTFQQAVKDTRDSLKAYRKALVQLIDSLKGASTGTDDNSTNAATE